MQTTTGVLHSLPSAVKWDSVGIQVAATMLTGSYDLTIDQKNRLSVPFAVRRKLDETNTGHSFYVMPGRRPGTLALYPEKVFERKRSNPPADEDLSDEAYEWRQWELSQTVLVDPDGQGRLLLPDRLLKRVEIESEVTLNGMHDHLELWSREAFTKFDDSKWPNYSERWVKAKGETRALEEKQRVGRTTKEIAIVQVGGDGAG